IGRVQEIGQQTILLTLTGSGHDPTLALGAGRLDEIIERLDVRTVRMDPEEEGILCHPSNRRELADIDAELRPLDRSREEAVQGEQQHMIVTRPLLEMDQRIGTRIPWNVHWIHRDG